MEYSFIHSLEFIEVKYLLEHIEVRDQKLSYLVSCSMNEEW